MQVSRNDNDSILLLTRFNRRDPSAFALVYTQFFTELHIYAGRLYSNTSVSAEDAVQDAFCYLWERENIVFDNFVKIKAFLFVAMKNRYKNHVSHLDVEQRYKDAVEHDSHFSEDIAESEWGASLLEYVERIPDPGGRVMKLYLTGYEAEEIAETLQLSIRTVYNVKSRAIGILKKYFSK